MRRLLLSALLIATAAPALAQVSLPPPDVRERDRGYQNGDRRPDLLGPDERPVRPEDRRPEDRRFDERRSDERRDLRRDERDARQDERRQDERREYRQDERRDGRRAYRDDRRAYGDSDRFARFHGDRYYYPRGFGYRSYGIGTIVPRAYFDQRYYIGRPDFYRLPPAFAGTRWVRVGPDALLIRRFDGRIVRVIRGLFY